MAANTIMFDKEKREIDRIKQQLQEQRKELEAARAFFASQPPPEPPAAARPDLSASQLAAIHSQYAELASTLLEVRKAFAKRAYPHHQLDHRLAPSGSPDRRPSSPGLYEHAVLQYMTVLQQQVERARAYLAPGGPGVQACEVAEHLREQHLQLLRLVQHMASDADSYSERLERKEGQVREMQEEQGRLRAEMARLAADASAVARLQRDNEGVAREAAEMRAQAKATKVKLHARAKEQVSHVVTQNRQLR